MAVGREMPFPLPLGTDGKEVVWQKCLERLRIYEKWEGLFREKQQVMDVSDHCAASCRVQTIAKTETLRDRKALLLSTS